MSQHSCFAVPRVVCRSVCQVVIGLIFVAIADSQRTSSEHTAYAADNTPFSLEYVPRDAVAVFAARPAAVLRRPAIAAQREAIDHLARQALRWNVRLDEVTEVKVILLPSQGYEPAVAVSLCVTSPDTAGKIVASLGAEAQPREFARRDYFRQDSGACYFQPDATSVVFSPDEPTLRRCLAAGAAGATSTKWAASWGTVAPRDAAGVVNSSLLRAADVSRASDGLEEFFGGPSTTSMLTVWQLAPLWQRSEYILAELEVTEAVVLHIVSQSATEDEARQVQSALLTAVSMIRAILSRGRAAIAAQGDPALMLYETIDLVDEILEKAHVVREDLQVRVATEISADATVILTQAALSLFVAAQQASARLQSLSHLKQIALAMHNYHDVYKSFPAAVQLGPNNTPCSWRVTLLPFLEQTALYEEYRQDEPWESEHNRRVLAAMPGLYRCPLDQQDSMHASYFVLVGPDTVFPGNERVRLRDISDGAAITLMVIESKQATPWTKPEDIPFDPAQPLQTLGGWYADGFHAALCDGTVRFFDHEDTDQHTLRLLIRRSDGDSIQPPR